MKHYEKNLLDNLELQKLPNDTPLKNIKDALGSVAYIVGNPLFKAEIHIAVTVFYRTFMGVPILPAALPAAEQQKFPVFLFGLTDFYGGYHASRTIVQSIPPWLFSNSQILAYTLPNPPGAGLGDDGDFLMTFQDPVTMNFAFVNVHCDTIAYGTFLSSFVSDLITVNQIRLLTPVANINQFINPLVFGYLTLFGKVSTDSVDPRMYSMPKDPQNNIVDIPLHFPIDKRLIIGTYIEFDTPYIDFIFFAEKVEPLTHKL